MRRCPERWDTTINWTSSGKSRARDFSSGEHHLHSLSLNSNINIWVLMSRMCACVCVCASGSWKHQTRSWTDKRIVWSIWNQTQMIRSMWRRNVELMTELMNFKSRWCLTSPSDLWTLCLQRVTALHSLNNTFICPFLVLISTLESKLQDDNHFNDKYSFFQIKSRNFGASFFLFGKYIVRRRCDL